MYKFVSFKDLKSGRWVLEISDGKMLNDYHEKYFTHIIKEHLNELKTKELGDIHNWEKWNTSFGRAVAALAPTYGSMISAATHLENDFFRSKAKDLRREGKIYCDDDYTYFTTDETPVHTIEKIEMIYPQYGIDDIRIINWGEHGKHFYAKIGNHDVVGVGDLQKWDSHDEAYEYAVKFLKECNE